jgi:hypothetical protein
LKFAGNKNKLILVATLCLVIGATSAALIAGKGYFSDNKVNVLACTKGQCPAITWVHPIDSFMRAYPVSITGELYFAGERVPLEDPEVRERLERELEINVFWRSNTLLGMKLANRYFTELSDALKVDSVPDDFKYLALIESDLRDEVSPAGAVGFWQLLKSTAKTYGLEVNDEVDERYNIEKSTKVASAYLKDAHEKLGSWTMAAASYNLGLSGTMHRMADQKANNYYDMFFNPETSRYVFRMLAMKIIFSDPEKAGFIVQPDELYQPYKYKVIEVDTGIASISDFAAQFGLKYKHIKIANTWLRDARLTNREHKKYEIKILDRD